MTGSAATQPVSAVLAEFRAGATSLTGIADATGLDVDLVRLAVDRLVSLGQLTRQQLSTGCPSFSCGDCFEQLAGATPCGTRSTGPVLLRLAAPARPAP